MSEKTIAAIATPLGEGGIGVIRISGDDALAVAERCFKTFSGAKLSSLSPYSAAYGEVFDRNGILDDGVALVFRAPKSYTGEDVVEISVHGGRIILSRALRAVFAAGAFPADRGEFTKRAFLNGKMDLTEAESICELICAKNDAALRISKNARGGRISSEADRIISLLTETAASLSVYSDYPDEEIKGLDPENFGLMLRECRTALSKLADTYDTGKLVREGIDCAIVGRPNVGKSTLMNLICGNERSIVTDVAGTTRDVIETTVTLGDITLNLSDTAGIHETGDTVEKVGVERALDRLESSALVLAVFDGAQPLNADDTALLKRLSDRKTIVVINKSDLENRLSEEKMGDFPKVRISAKNGEGIEQLTRIIAEMTYAANLDPDDAVLISERQLSCVNRALDAVNEAATALSGGVTLDAVGVCVDDALAALLELTGKRVTNEVTDEVFKRFCVGK